MISEPALKCDNNASFKQIYTLSNGLFLLIQLRGNLDFPEFLQKKFYNINYWYPIISK